MSRNSSGTYTLPAGNPVVSGTVIEASWANGTLSDLAAAMTDSLSRSGQGGMTAPLRIIDGSVSVPSLAFANETGSGAYRAAAGDWGLTVLGSRIVRLRSSGVDVAGNLGVSGNLTVTGASTHTGDASFANLAYTGTLTGGYGVVNIGSGQIYKAADGKVGIGTATPLSPFQVHTGTNINLAVQTSSIDATGSVVSGYNDAGNALIPLWLNGSYLGFATSNVERMRIDSAGKVGIGTASPYSTLDVGTRGAQIVTSLFTTGVDDLNFRTGFANGVAGGTGSLQGLMGLFYLGTGESATIGFVRGASATDGSVTFRTAGTERGRFDDLGNFKFNSGYGSAATAYGCRAWVNFNGAGTVSIRASGNVSSVSDNGAGSYAVNFGTAMPDANYATEITSQRSSSWVDGGDAVAASATTFVAMYHVENSVTTDTSVMCVTVFR